MVTSDKKIDSNSAEVVRSFIATWNTHDTSAILDLLDPDIVFRSLNWPGDTTRARPHPTKRSTCGVRDGSVLSRDF
jgi:hypothetical protein